MWLTEVRRQRDAADRAALADLRDGRPAEWLRSADERGQLVVDRGAEAQYEHLVSDWWHGREGLGEGEALMLAPTRDATWALNERARAYMRQAGRLGEVELAAGGRGFAEGDRVMCLQNARDIGVLNGLRGTVVAVEEGSRSLRVALDGRELVSSYLGHPAGHGEVAISHLELAAGEDPVTSALVRAGEDLLVGDRHRCLLDHVQALQELVEDHTDAHVAVDVADAALAAIATA